MAGSASVRFVRSWTTAESAAICGEAAMLLLSSGLRFWVSFRGFVALGSESLFSRTLINSNQCCFYATTPATKLGISFSFSKL